MRLQHPDHPGRTVRLGYCLNVHAAESVAGVMSGLREVTAPVARSIAGEENFGIGPWLAATVVGELETDSANLRQLATLLVAERLVPFTFNAFPFGGFHTSGLKAAVFRPTWLEPERAEFTLAVAKHAIALQDVGQQLGEPVPAHVSISTHCGGFGSDIAGEGERSAVAEAFALAARALADLEGQSGQRVILSLEPEPRSSANDCAALPELFERARQFAPEDLLQRHLGACLDTCHTAVEFEDPTQAYLDATDRGHPLGKLQFSSALRLPNPAQGQGLQRLLDLAEPTFLHQVTGRTVDGLLRVDDLPDLRQAWDSESSAWQACDELRCHFHVPVDLDQLSSDLVTTRATADTLLSLALSQPERWGSAELHVEVETYTWDILPPEARGAGGLVGGIGRELTHVLELLKTHGWHH